MLSSNSPDALFPSGAAVDAAPLPRSRADVIAQIRRVNAALVAWDHCDANRALPPDLRRPVAEPPLDRATLKGARQRLVSHLRHLGGG